MLLLAVRPLPRQHELALQHCIAADLAVCLEALAQSRCLSRTFSIVHRHISPYVFIQIGIRLVEVVQGRVGARAQLVNWRDAARWDLGTSVVEHLIQCCERTLGMPLLEVDACEERLCILHDVGSVTRAEYTEGTLTLLPGSAQLLQLDLGLADAQVRKADSLLIGELNAELACCCELLDRRGVVVHRAENDSAQEPGDGQAERLSMRGIPVDDLLIESQRLGVVPHGPHDRGECVCGENTLVRHRGHHAGTVGLRQCCSCEVRTVQPVLQAAERDQQTRIARGAGCLRAARRFDRLGGIGEARLIVDVLRVG